MEDTTELSARGPSWAALDASLKALASSAMEDVLARVGPAPGVTPFVLHRRSAAAAPQRRAFSANSFDEAMQAYRDWAQSEASVGQFVQAYELPPAAHRTISLHVEIRGTKPAHSILQLFDWTPSGPVIVGEPSVGITDNDAPCPRFDDIARARLDAAGRGEGLLVLADKQVEPRSVAIVGSLVCWYGHRARRIYRVSLEGGPTHAVCSLADDIRAMETDNDTLVAATATSLLRIDPRTGRVETLADWRDDDEAFDGANTWLVVDGDSIYINDGGRITCVPRGGGPPRTIGRADAEMTGLAVRDGLVVTAIPERSAIVGLPVAGGPLRKLASTPGRPYIVTTSGDTLVWTEPDDGAVRLLDGSFSKLGASDPSALASSGGHVVWLETSTVMHLDATSGGLTMLGSELARPSHVAIGDGVVACSLTGHDEGLGKIIRLDLPS